MISNWEYASDQFMIKACLNDVTLSFSKRIFYNSLNWSIFNFFTFFLLHKFFKLKFYRWLNFLLNPDFSFLLLPNTRKRPKNLSLDSGRIVWVRNAVQGKLFFLSAKLFTYETHTILSYFYQKCSIKMLWIYWTLKNFNFNFLNRILMLQTLKFYNNSKIINSTMYYYQNPFFYSFPGQFYVLPPVIQP